MLATLTVLAITGVAPSWQPCGCVRKDRALPRGLHEAGPPRARSPATLEWDMRAPRPASSAPLMRNSRASSVAARPQHGRSTAAAVLRASNNSLSARERVAVLCAHASAEAWQGFAICCLLHRFNKTWIALHSQSSLFDQKLTAFARLVNSNAVYCSIRNKTNYLEDVYVLVTGT